MKRRDFLKSVALSGAAISLQSWGTLDLMAQSTTQGNFPDLVAVMGGEPDAMFERAIAEMGGMSRFVKPGEKIVVKPNIGWDKTPEMGSNTNPILVAAVVKSCLAAGAKEVTVFDHTCDDWRKAYTHSGIEEAAKKAGAKVVPADQESYYREVQLPKSKQLKTAKIHQAILDCDRWINVPVLKNHGGANLTISMKNLMGIVWDRGAFHQQNLQQCIADICTLSQKPVLNIVDAYRVMQANGPKGVSQADSVTAKGLFVSSDIVAVDTAAAKFFNQIKEMPLESVAHLANGEALRVGTTQLDKLSIKRIKI